MSIESLPERFWTKVDKNGPEIYPGIGRCWLWTGTKRGVYPSFGIGSRKDGTKRTVALHRFILSLKLGRKLLPRIDACHKCDVPTCVNPDHLFEGTRRDNVLDSVNKGRFNRPRGAKHVRAKLTEEKVQAILSDSRMHKVLAAEYKVTRSIISKIKSRSIWKHVS